MRHNTEHNALSDKELEAVSGGIDGAIYCINLGMNTEIIKKVGDKKKEEAQTLKFDPRDFLDDL